MPMLIFVVELVALRRRVVIRTGEFGQEDGMSDMLAIDKADD